MTDDGQAGKLKLFVEDARQFSLARNIPKPKPAGDESLHPLLPWTDSGEPSRTSRLPSRRNGLTAESKETKESINERQHRFRLDRRVVSHRLRSMVALDGRGTPSDES